MKKSYLSDADDGGKEGREEKLVLYGVEDTPAVHLCFLFGLQVYNSFNILEHIH